jgi:hypothetical protein
MELIFIFVAIGGFGLIMILGALSTLIKYHQLAKLPPPERRWSDRIREPKITPTNLRRQVAQSYRRSDRV